jgi:sterol desaturase/sphingolipid hydroxylase (fatty acid hydroxylase superfamily)
MNFKALIMQHEDVSQIIFYALIITSLWSLESLICAASSNHKWRHTFVNAGFIFTALPIQLTMTGFVIIIMKWTNIHHWGLIYYIPKHQISWVYYVSLFMLMDLGEYTYHVIMHKYDFLWRFHLVHHSDLKIDVSTTVREHPGETCVRTTFLMFWVFIFGPGIGVLMLRQVFQSFFNVLAHTEFRLPEKINNIVGFVFITPNLHHVHHHYQLPYTNSNYGDVLSIWDRIFGTYRELQSSHTKFGIDTHMEPALNSRYLSIIKIPFQKFKRPETHTSFHSSLHEEQV